MNLKSKFYLFIIFIATLFIGIGYASINSISLDISGTSQAKSQDKVFITNIEYIEDENSNLTENLIVNSASQTILNSKISLTENDKESKVKIAITVYNSSNEDYVFVGTFFDDEFYDNKNIIFELENLEIEKILPKGDYYTFYVNFKYKNEESANSGNNILNSSIDYRFEPFRVKETLSGIEFNYQLKNSTYEPEGDVYEYYSVDSNRAVDNSVKIIVFGKTSDYSSQVSGLTKEPLDLYRTGSISMYRKVLDDGKYKIYILSDTGKFILNENAAWMFDKLYSLEEIINLHLLDTSKVTNMRDMFCDCAVLKNVDLSNFKTENVTNMIGMFARMKEITYLDLSTFDTNNVTEIGQIFSDDPKLKKIYVSNKWDLSKNVSAEDGVGVFSNCDSLVGGNGTTYDKTLLTYTMAVVDGTTPGYLTKGYGLDTGINVNHVIKNKTQTEIDGWTLSTRFVDTKVISLTFGETKDYNEKISGYIGTPVDSDKSGVISVYRIPNGSNYDVYILSNSGLFEANEDSSWLFDNLVLMQKINGLTYLNTSNVKNMRDMFCDTQTIKTLDLSNFNTYNATSFEGMFARMYNIEELDLSSFSTSSLTTIKNMFVHSISSTETHANYINIIPKLKTVYVSNKWDVSSLNETSVFSNNLSLVGGNGTVFDSTKVSSDYARADNNENPGYFTLK